MHESMLSRRHIRKRQTTVIGWRIEPLHTLLRISEIEETSSTLSGVKTGKQVLCRFDHVS
jgi:hypothetical protein